MEVIDLAHKLAYAGSRSPVPFTTGPEFTNSVPGVPVLSSIRLFVPREQWSNENLFIVAREVCRILGGTAQFDIGFAVAGRTVYDPNRPASGDTARLTKLDANSSTVVLRVASEAGDALYEARFPRLQFEPAGSDQWRSVYAPGAVKDAVQP
jgi:hypothetical protein